MIMRAWVGKEEKGDHAIICLYINTCSTIEPMKSYVWVIISEISFSTSSPTLFPLYHHYKLAPVSPYSITSSSPLMGPHNAKQSVSRPPPPQLYTACRPSPPSSISPSTRFYSQLHCSSPQFHQHPLDLTSNIYTSCLKLTLHFFPHHLQLWVLLHLSCPTLLHCPPDTVSQHLHHLSQQPHKGSSLHSPITALHFLSQSL